MHQDSKSSPSLPTFSLLSFSRDLDFKSIFNESNPITRKTKKQNKTLGLSKKSSPQQKEPSPKQRLLIEWEIFTFYTSDDGLMFLAIYFFVLS